MQVLGCGFTGAPDNLLSSFGTRWESSGGLGNGCQIASGGWGCFAVIKSGAVQLQHGQLKQQLSDVPQAPVTAAALGWTSVLGTTSTGLLYSCALPSALSASSDDYIHSNEALQQVHIVTVKWKQLSLPTAVQAVAAGEHHSSDS